MREQWAHSVNIFSTLQKSVALVQRWPGLCGEDHWARMTESRSVWCTPAAPSAAEFASTVTTLNTKRVHTDSTVADTKQKFGLHTIVDGDGNCCSIHVKFYFSLLTLFWQPSTRFTTWLKKACQVVLTPLLCAEFWSGAGEMCSVLHKYLTLIFQGCTQSLPEINRNLNKFRLWPSTN